MLAFSTDRLARSLRSLACMLAVAVAVAAPAAHAAEADLDALLGRYVTAGTDGVDRVDYAAWHAARDDRARLDRFVVEEAARRPSALPRAAAFAYWANLYNALTLKVILDSYPVKSIRDIKSEGIWLDPKAYLGPWRTPRVEVEGRKLSLDAIEHEIMRPTFKDPRVHYSINCASVGCPNLRSKAWRAETLDADLDAAARSYVNHPRGVTVSGAKLTVSSIYVWFKDDFGGSDKGVIAHLKAFAAPDLAARLAGVARIDRDTYDWTLNSAPTGGRG